MVEANKMYPWLPRQLAEMAKEVFKFISSTTGIIWLSAVIAAGSAWGWLDLGKSVIYLALTAVWFLFLFMAKKTFAKFCFAAYTLVYIFLLGWVIK